MTGNSFLGATRLFSCDKASLAWSTCSHVAVGAAAPALPHELVRMLDAIGESPCVADWGMKHAVSQRTAQVRQGLAVLGQIYRDADKFFRLARDQSGQAKVGELAESRPP